ncbi:MAG: dienelactone hydrolase family protein [Thermoplasmata archaeon]|nr:dienelactone hydrolase family protein [Thermoplasmata archaeon]
MPRDDDELLSDPTLQFGSGVIGVCDVCGHRQAVIVLQKERFQLCVLDFLNKTWTRPGLTAGAPLPPYRSERIFFPTGAVPGGKAPGIVLTPTKLVRHPLVFMAPDIYGLTTSVLDGAIRFAREGFEVFLPDVSKTHGVGPSDHVSLRVGARFRGGVPLTAARTIHLRRLYTDGLRFLRDREMADPTKSAIVGLSYGGSLAIAIAAEDADLTAAVFAYPMPVRPSDQIGLVNASVLFVHAGADAMSRRARAQFESLGAKIGVRYADFPTAHHNFLARDLSAYDLPSAEAAWSQILAFVKEKLLPPPPKPPTPPKATVAAPPVASAPSGALGTAPATPTSA